MSASFVETHGAVVVENHLNMVRPINGEPKVSPGAVTAFFNSDIVDRAFRCISGSVAVSAFELEALPLPSVDDMKDIEKLIKRGAPTDKINKRLQIIYMGEED
jgi:adenine-specific DNA-methyltransferase